MWLSPVFKEKLKDNWLAVESIVESVVVGGIVLVNQRVSQRQPG